MQLHERASQPKFRNFRMRQGVGIGDEGNSHEVPGFLSAIGKVTDIEALNGATKALKILHQTAIAGGPKVQKMINDGGKGVLNAVTGAMGFEGGGDKILETVNRSNPSAVNHAIGAAEVIHDKIANGNFQVEDIPLYVRDFANLFKEIGKIMTPKESLESDFREISVSPNYASNMLQMGVKLNHRFLVMFNIAPEYRSSLGVWDQALMVYSAERPGMNINYVDVNKYSYRTKVPVSVTYDPIRISLYDDEDGQTNSFINLFQKIISPISNINPAGQILYDMEVMNYKGLDNPSGLHSVASMPRDFSATENIDYNPASLGYLKDGAPNVFTSITLFHLYQGSALMDMYSLANPRIMSISRSGLDMEENEVSTVDLAIDFDTVYTDTYLPSGDIVYRLNTGNKNDLSSAMDIENFAAAFVPETENIILEERIEAIQKKNEMIGLEQKFANVGNKLNKIKKFV